MNDNNSRKHLKGIGNLIIVIAIIVSISIVLINGSKQQKEREQERIFKVSQETSETIEQEPTPQPFEVTLSAENISNSATPSFLITTNLPNGTNLLLTLENGNGYTAQDKIVVYNNEATSSTFSYKGNQLSGQYTLKISMGKPSLQNNSVKKIIGENGELMYGNFVVSDILAGNSFNNIKAEFIFNF